MELANSADYELTLGNDADETHSLANGLHATDGWALIARYGDFPHPGVKGEKKPVIQRFNREIAEQLVANFKHGMSRIRRAVVGLPVFNGHPDVKGYEALFPDKRVYGTFADLEARADGFYGKPILTNDGGRLVEDGKDRLSPTWRCEKIGETGAGLPIVAPFHLKSVGLVASGNIPGPSLMNADLNPTTSSPMNNAKDLLIQLLVALGYDVPNGISDDALAALTQTAVSDCKDDETANADITDLKPTSKTVPAQRRALIAARKALAAEKAALEGEKVILGNAKTELEGDKVTLGNAKTTLEQERDGLKTQLATERKERAVLLVNAAIVEGRIVAAQRDAEVLTLCNAADFKAAVASLAAKTKILRTTSQTAELGKGRADGGARQTKIMELVNARMEETDEDYTTAFSFIQNNPAHAALFAEMKKPGTTG